MVRNMNKPQKLELTWIGKDEQPRVELLLEFEKNKVGQIRARLKAEHFELL